MVEIKTRERRLSMVESLVKECFGRGCTVGREGDYTVGIYKKTSGANVASIEIKSYAGSMVLRDWASFAMANFFVEQYRLLNLESPGMRKTILNRLGIESFALKVDYPK